MLGCCPHSVSCQSSPKSLRLSLPVTCLRLLVSDILFENAVAGMSEDGETPRPSYPSELPEGPEVNSSKVASPNWLCRTQSDCHVSVCQQEGLVSLNLGPHLALPQFLPVYLSVIYYMFIPTMPWWVWRSETSFVRLSTLNTSPALDILTLKVTGSFFKSTTREE